MTSVGRPVRQGNGKTRPTWKLNGIAQSHRFAQPINLNFMYISNVA